MAKITKQEAKGSFVEIQSLLNTTGDWRRKGDDGLSIQWHLDTIWEFITAELPYSKEDVEALVGAAKWFADPPPHDQYKIAGRATDGYPLNAAGVARTILRASLSKFKKEE